MFNDQSAVKSDGMASAPARVFYGLQAAGRSLFPSLFRIPSKMHGAKKNRREGRCSLPVFEEVYSDTPFCDQPGRPLMESWKNHNSHAGD
ncbi:hypothetical protein U1Q18_027593 [Sarracenia purpurea var. burkii]